MPLTVERLEVCVSNAVAAESATSLATHLAPVLAVLAAPDEMGRSFLRGLGAESACDYAGVQAAFQRLCSKATTPWAHVAVEKVRAAIVDVLDYGLASLLREPGEGEQDDTGTSTSTTGLWTAALLSAMLPLMADTLPRDSHGICVIPHRHHMEKQTAREDGRYFTSSGRLAFRTNKVCDNCQTRIVDQHFYHCSENCDIDFCQECNLKLHEVFGSFVPHGEDRSNRFQTLDWVITASERIAVCVLHLAPKQRVRLAHELAFGWPTSLFEQLIRVVIDVVNAKVVHVQDVKDIRSDKTFWYTVGLLQFLYAANSLPCETTRVGEQCSRGPKVEYGTFILEGINKCEPMSEWRRYRAHPGAKVPDVLTVENVELTADFCSFLTHNNLVPVSFRRVCLLCDIWDQVQLEVMPLGQITPLQIEVRRGPCILEDVLKCFEGLTDNHLRRPLRVTFEGEEGAGPGVTTEFFQVVLRGFFDDNCPLQLFRYIEHQRTYWFNKTACNYQAFRACGILLGQAVLNNILVPNIFPRVLYDRLLQDLGSTCTRPLGLEDLASVSRETAQSLQRILDYTAEDIGTVFADLDWAATGCPLSQASKEAYVRAYVSWFFHERTEAQLRPLSDGFRTILGGSPLLQNLVDAVQLEQIVCGGSVPVDIAAIRRGAKLEGWSDEVEYLTAFWEILEDLSDAEKREFVVFSTASDRVPLRGWQDLHLRVQKNGVGDERLPTAHTCFRALLLPRYSSREQLKAKLRFAIANSQGFGLR